MYLQKYRLNLASIYFLSYIAMETTLGGQERSG